MNHAIKPSGITPAEFEAMAAGHILRRDLSKLPTFEQAARAENAEQLARADADAALPVLHNRRKTDQPASERVSLAPNGIDVLGWDQNDPLFLRPIALPESEPGKIIKFRHSLPSAQPEYTGGSVGYYKVDVRTPTTPGVKPYVAECNDIIEALGMDFAEGNAFKAIWRKAAARQGKRKKGYESGLYDAEKVAFFGARMVALEKARAHRDDLL